MPACLQKMPLLICSNGVANWVIWKMLAACCRDGVLCSFLPLSRHQARTPRECCLSVHSGQVPAPIMADLCHPETAKPVEAWPILSAESYPWLWKSLNSRKSLLCLLGLTFPRPGREYCLREGNCVFHYLSGFPSFPPAQLHFSVLFLDPSKAEQHLCCDFQEVWVWVCTEDPRGVHCLDFVHRASIHCSRARLAFLVIFTFFSQLTVLPSGISLPGLQQTPLPGKPVFQTLDE